MEHEEVLSVKVQPVDIQKVKKIWKVAGILAAVTFIEFTLAFTMPRGMGLNSLFIILTLIKAFYIVAEFMHLAHEVKSLVYCIVVPIILIIWLLTALLIEGYEVFLAKFF